jgi:hypothetical protein
MLSITSTLVAQRFFNNDTGFGLMRYNSDGSLDSSFGENGGVVTKGRRTKLARNSRRLGAGPG